MPDAPGRLVAIDPGRRRVGLAVSDPLRLFARPVGTYAPREAVAWLRAEHAREPFAGVVYGWPLDEDGAEGAAVDAVRPLLAQVERALPGVPVVRQDERYTSEAAKSRLYEAGRWGKARRDKGQIDAEAACVLLEDALRER